MSYDSEVAYSNVAVQAESSERAAFIRRTYAHLAGAILAFVGLEALLLQFVTIKDIAALFGQGYIGLLVLMVAFMGASWLAQTWARSETSRTLQYLGLSLFVVAEALIILPLLCIANTRLDSDNLIGTAGILTLCVFGGLTAAVFITRKDYSFLGPYLAMASFLVFGLIIAGWLLGWGLGLWFSFGMVALMSFYILYQTSNIMLHYRTDQHVAAALALFSSVATLFYYILRILMMSSRR